MLNSKNFFSLGLMSGTSADGIDIALLETDGKNKIRLGPNDYYPFSKSFTKKIKSIFSKKINFKKLKNKKRIDEIEDDFTKLNFLIIKKFLKKNKISRKSIHAIGFHGQTISHNPSKGYSWQIGDSQKLANLLKIKVIGNFRQNDIDHKGQGAPLTPIFHYYLTKRIKKKICFINLVGISNISYFNHKLKENLNNILAFDPGPCCSLIDDWVTMKSDKKFDNKGLIAKKGNVNDKIVKNFLKNPYFLITPPKSLDRSFFSLKKLKNLTLEDGAATLNEIIAESLLLSFNYLPKFPEFCILSGGGRKNDFLINLIKKKINNTQFVTSEKYRWDGDSIEAYAFAYLSVRKLLNLPITFPKTTGVTKPLTGGQLFTFG